MIEYKVFETEEGLYDPNVLEHLSDWWSLDEVSGNRVTLKRHVTEEKPKETITVNRDERGDYHLTLSHYVAEGWKYVEKDKTTVTFQRG